MDLESRIGRDLHGEFVGHYGFIECDYPPPHVESIDPSGRILYEVIRVVGSPSLDGRLPIPDGWHLDAARCRDHEVTRIPIRTRGFDEALVTLEVDTVEGVAFAVDGASIRLLDRSPPEEGGQPVEAPPAFVAEAIEAEDVGFDRLVRQAAFFPLYLGRGYYAFVDELLEAMAEGDADKVGRRRPHG